MRVKFFSILGSLLLLSACEVPGGGYDGYRDSRGTEGSGNYDDSYQSGSGYEDEDIIDDSEGIFDEDDEITGSDYSNSDYRNREEAQSALTKLGDRVLFGSDSSKLDAEDQAILRRQAEWLKKNPGINVIIEGHCDERGTREYNFALGERRASAIKNYLVSLGISGNRLSSTSYGKEKPVALGSTPDAWTKNRRGMTVVN